MKRHGPVNVIFYHPKSESGKQELAKRVAEVHADAVTRRIKKLNCPTSKKLELLDAVISTAKQRAETSNPISRDNSPYAKDTDCMER